MNNRITLILNYIILVFSIAINPSYWGKNIKKLKIKKKKNRAKSLKEISKVGKLHKGWLGEFSCVHVQWHRQIFGGR